MSGRLESSTIIRSRANEELAFDGAHGGKNHASTRAARNPKPTCAQGSGMSKLILGVTCVQTSPSRGKNCTVSFLQGGDRTFEREKLSKYVCWAGEIKESMYVLKVEKWERIRVLTAQGWARYRQVDWRLLKRGVARAIIYLAKFAHMRTVDSRLDVAIPFPDTKCSV